MDPARRARSRWIAGVVAAILAASIAGCGGGDSGPAGPAGPQGPGGEPRGTWLNVIEVKPQQAETVTVNAAALAQRR